jgi:hypothetical protein
MHRHRLSVATACVALAATGIAQAQMGAGADYAASVPKLPPAGLETLQARVERDLRRILTTAPGVADADLVARLRSAILADLGSDPAALASAQLVLARIAPDAFGDPPAVARAIAEARVALSSKLHSQPTAMIGAFHAAGPTHSYGQMEMGPAAAAPPPFKPPPLSAPVQASPTDAGPADTPQSHFNAHGVRIVKPATTGPASTPTALAGLPVAYNAPSTLPLGVKTDFRLVIGSSHAPTDADFADVPGKPKSHLISPGVKIVKAVMTGPAGWVDIDASGSPACQQVTTDANPTWDWFVTPRTTHQLNLSVEIDEVSSCDQAAPVVDRVDNFSIPVSADLWQLIVLYSKSWQTVLTAIFALIAAGGAAFGAWRWLGGKSK